MPLFSHTTRLPAPASAVFALHADARNLPRLMPPGLVRALHAPSPTREGDVQVIDVGPAPFTRRWVARVERLQPPWLLVDVQRRGPFRRFRHMHVIVPDGDGSVLVDLVDARLFPGRPGAVLDRLLLAPALRLLFAERHRRTRALLASAVPATAGAASTCGGRGE